MPLSRARDYLSIGEVLETVRGDFPDVSISKIRFLETEGLLTPERTSSGYRKFYEQDVQRLRYILSLQRDHFLPLKVIRERLAEGAPEPVVPAAPASSPENGAKPRAKGAPAKGPSTPVAAPQDLAEVQLSRAELLKTSGLTEQQLGGLEDFGILEKKEGPYDGNDLLVAKASKGFLDHGVEPRHLRMYRQFTEREASFFEQLVSPVAHKRDPEGLEEAARTARELEVLGRSLREALMRATMRSLF